ncbi:MAG: peptidase [Enterovirga sp.]|nr:peptidase [Enterovirga sp.]
MSQDMIDALCGAVSADRMMAHLAEFARREKLSGTPQEYESFRYLQARLDEYGFRTNLIRHDAYISLPGKAGLEVAGASPGCITHSFSRPSPEGGLRGGLVYGGAGRPEDFARIDVAGKIVLLEGIANPGASFRSSEAGAIGQIHISPHEHLHEMCISPVWGNPTDATRNRLPRTTVLSIRKADGDALKARLQAGEAVEATLHAEVDTGWRQIPLLEADLDAPDGGPDGPFVMFSGHHDTWYLGVMDNGGANATMLEVARLLAEQRRGWRRGLRLCFWSGHSHGRYAGSTWYADTRWGELAARCAAHVNVDSTGAKGNTVMSDALSSAELRGLAAEAVRAQGGQELDGHRMSRAGDQSFWGIGIPSLFMGIGEQPVGAENPMAAVFGGGSGRKGAGFGWWWHTPDDTLDKMDPDLLVRDTRVYVHAIWRLLTDPVLPLDYGAAASGLADELADLSGRVGDALDLAPLAESVERLRSGAAALVARAGAASPGPDAEALNRALVAVSRAFVPIDYTSGDLFEPDPALAQSPFPVLDPIRRLAAAPPGSEAARFLAVAALRARNRVAYALGQANAALAAVA